MADLEKTIQVNLTGVFRLRRFALARILAGLQVACIFWGWTASQYPYLVPPDLTIEGSAAPPVTLKITLWAVAGGTPVLARSWIFLFRVFKSGPDVHQPVPR